ncbi:putative Basic helix-loop-helix DNA-binding superfamily protein [Hibiscus syriacus]|uniref:Basic helix-loop-helix DNA-binding superfamily protein n=1 Tax=Hibiscus syriacus TaxID=106335 RepID=A0A6A3C496_HIBSY|nr:putative Basic helix-loop-helix DNA-binding superfamily protein [Hibiscus syriacus]
MINDEDRVKDSWSPQEDANLIKLEEQHGPRTWSMISSAIPGRSGKFCRIRWCNQLSPAVQQRPFTAAEDAVIIQAHAVHGNKWATIAILLLAIKKPLELDFESEKKPSCRPGHQSRSPGVVGAEDVADAVPTRRERGGGGGAKGGGGGSKK